jgi:hypothetical protein
VEVAVLREFTKGFISRNPEYGKREKEEAAAAAV